MESQIPGGIPRVLPFVGHRNDIRVTEMSPAAVPAAPALSRRFRPGRVAPQPAPDVVVVELLAPEHAGESLPLDSTRVLSEVVLCDGVVEFVSLTDTLRKQLIKSSPERAFAGSVDGQAQLDGYAFTAADVKLVPGRGLGPQLCRIDRLLD